MLSSNLRHLGSSGVRPGNRGPFLRFRTRVPHDGSLIVDGDRTVKAAVPSYAFREPFNGLIRTAVWIDLMSAGAKLRHTGLALLRA
jgi:hypothetical protein